MILLAPFFAFWICRRFWANQISLSPKMGEKRSWESWIYQCWILLIFICLLQTIDGKGVFYTRPFARDDNKIKETTVAQPIENKTIIVKKCVHILVLKTSTSGSNWFSKHLKSDRATSTKVVFDPIIYGSAPSNVKSISSNKFPLGRNPNVMSSKTVVGGVNKQEHKSDSNSFDSKSLECGDYQLVSLMSSPILSTQPPTMIKEVETTTTSVLVDTFNKTIKEFHLTQFPQLRVIKFIRTNIVKTAISFTRKLKIESCIKKVRYIESYTPPPINFGY